MDVTAKYDPEADALYVRISDGIRKRAVEVDDTTYVDVDSEGRPVGIEWLYPSLGISLAGVAQQFRLHQLLPAIAEAIAQTDAPIAAPTVTGGMHLASTTITTMTVEGTIGAAYELGEPSIAHPDRVIRIPA
jgi:uncharacterized protein YuzE